MLVHNIPLDLELAPNFTIEYFFVDANVSNLELTKEISGLDSTCSNLESITCFLMLPTFINTFNLKKYNVDLIVDFF